MQFGSIRLRIFDGYAETDGREVLFSNMERADKTEYEK